MCSSPHGATDPARSLLLQGLPMDHSLFCASTCGCGSPPWAAGESQLPHHGLQHGLHHGLPGNLSSGISHTSSSSFPDLGVCRVIAFTYSHSCLWLQFCRSFFCPLSNTLFRRCYHCHWWAWPCLAVGPSQSWLSLALLNRGGGF